MKVSDYETWVIPTSVFCFMCKTKWVCLSLGNQHPKNRKQGVVSGGSTKWVCFIVFKSESVLPLLLPLIISIIVPAAIFTMLSHHVSLFSC